jgi:hypothetical protein
MERVEVMSLDQMELIWLALIDTRSPIIVAPMGFLLRVHRTAQLIPSMGVPPASQNVQPQVNVHLEEIVPNYQRLLVAPAQPLPNATMGNVLKTKRNVLFQMVASVLLRYDVMMALVWRPLAARVQQVVRLELPSNVPMVLAKQLLGIAPL